MFLVAQVLLASTVAAVEPVIWRDDHQAAFSEGEPDGVSLTRDDVVILAPDLEEVADTGEPYVWSLARGRGGRLYIGTGSDGKIFSWDGRGEPSLLFDSPEVAVFSLAVGNGGDLFAGASPGGVIYRFKRGQAPSVGKVEPFCKTGDEHVWAIVPGPGGALHAATGGTHGRILRISPKGEVREIHKNPDHNVVSLVRGSDGTLYAGTDQSGLVYRIDSKGKAAVLYDAPQGEVHALALGPDGTVYAGAMTGKSRLERRQPGPSPNPEQSRPKPNGARSTLYAIRPSGAAFAIWEVSEPMLLALHTDPGGRITAVTGDRGAVYRLRDDGSFTLLTRMEDVQPWAVVPDAGGDLWIGTGGAGKIYRLGTAHGSKGALTSQAHDFSLVSNWGGLDWKGDTPGGTAIRFQTRSGNSEKPDETWSPWSGLLESPGPIGSPQARFLQYRATLSTPDSRRTPRLREVTLSGLQENVRPQIVSLDVGPMEGQNGPGGGGPPTGSGKNGGPGRRNAPESRSGIWRIGWSAADVNGDALVYTLYYRVSGERSWKLLEEELTTSSFLWNIESAPEGTLRVRIVASDRLANPESSALSAERISEPFDLDHTAPIVGIASVRQTDRRTAEVKGSVEDATTAIRRIDYALNAGPWKIVFPVDRICDSRSEALGFELGPLDPGEYTLVVRATDMLGNTGVGTTAFQIE
ncbi:MAG: hypothetical protein QGI83_24295 [Candidatus Latescibacteria bacterium]|nr:hypothetical protein [Candidatus Latescibacterota bacterium]